MSTPPVPPRPGDRRPDDAASRELLGAWALDAVTDAERAAVEDLMARDPDAAREGRSLRETAARLGGAVAAPAPDAVRAATLALAAATPQDGGADTGTRTGAETGTAAGAAEGTAHGSARRTGTVAGAAATPGPDAEAAAHRPPATSGAAGGSAAPAPPGRAAGSTRPPGRPDRAVRPGATARPGARRRWRSLVTALAVLALVAVPSTIAWRESQRAAEAEARADRIAAALAVPGAQVAGAELTTGGTAVAVLTADGALLTATGVEQPGDGRVYQLWVMRDGEPLPDATSAAPGGTFQVRTDVWRPGDALALTVEPAGGSEAPTSEPVVVLAAT
ncbi:anti-sigma factor [Cellulomonas sp. C5510]|uniref:anti-sigma factor n=1 Tax=Cellulomonas sp. C5510 TaxID=2871170 RepID=UPI001C946FFE|nr:anti-sigma factor [Cellulomonas sp. C5510]QZN85268.1 anti-sigma factor [Cellulomonas sp. C5510]